MMLYIFMIRHIIGSSRATAHSRSRVSQPEPGQVGTGTASLVCCFQLSSGLRLTFTHGHGCFPARDSGRASVVQSEGKPSHIPEEPRAWSREPRGVRARGPTGV